MIESYGAWDAKSGNKLQILAISSNNCVQFSDSMYNYYKAHCVRDDSVSGNCK